MIDRCEAVVELSSAGSSASSRLASLACAAAGVSLAKMSQASLMICAKAP